jgi:ABC-2 type transport system ATP-binding protein
VAAVLSALGLTKRFGEVAAVSDLTFDLHSGSVTGFLGPNGAGKTTTLRMVLGLAAPTSGRALVFGRPFVGLERPATRVGAVLEAADLHPGRTGRDHLRVLACAAGLRPGRVDDVLRLVDLREASGRRTGEYSLGMRQRLALAGALLGDPELLNLDEPGNGLDPAGVRWLRDFLRAFAGEGRTALISSHHLAEVQETVDEVVIINRGRLVVQSALAQLTAHRPGSAQVATESPSLEDVVLELTAGPT